MESVPRAGIYLPEVTNILIIGYKITVFECLHPVGFHVVCTTLASTGSGPETPNCVLESGTWDQLIWGKTPDLSPTECPKKRNVVNDGSAPVDGPGAGSDDELSIGVTVDCCCNAVLEDRSVGGITSASTF